MQTNELIRKIRGDLGITQEQLAKILKCRQGTVANYETGYRAPSLKTAKIILRLAQEHKLKIKLEDLLNESH